MDNEFVEIFPGLGYDSNIYLLNREVLIDAGTGHNTNNFFHWLKERVDPADIHTLILTHRHYDHTGGAVDIIEETGATAHIHELDAPPLQTGDAVTTGARVFRGDPVAIPVVPIREEHEFPIGNYRLRVIHTPGHTVGSISLHEPGLGILFPGDVLFANGGVGRWDLATGDHGTLKRSIDLLAGLNITGLYPGHDIPVRESGHDHVLLARESMMESPLDLMMRRIRYSR